MPLGVCGHCGSEDRDDRWVDLTITMSAGPRGPQRWSVVPTRIGAYPLCGACIASPWGEAVRAFLTDQWQAPVRPQGEILLDECSVVCINPAPRWRRRLSAWRADGPMYTRCPHCESVAGLVLIGQADEDEDELPRGPIRRLWAAWQNTIWPPKTLQE